MLNRQSFHEKGGPFPYQLRTGLLLGTLALGSACSLVTGSGDLDFSRETTGDGDETGGSAGDGDGMGGESSGGTSGDGDGSGGVASGGTASGGEGSGGDGSGGDTSGGGFTGITYSFDSDLEGWWLQPDASGWNVPPDPFIQGSVMRAEMTCLDSECEAIYFVILDPRAPAENLQLFAGFDFQTGAAGLYTCQFGFTCSEPVNWLWSAGFACEDIVEGLAAWNTHRDDNSTCSIYRFGIRLTTSNEEPSVLELDYLSLFPPE